MSIDLQNDGFSKAKMLQFKTQNFSKFMTEKYNKKEAAPTSINWAISDISGMLFGKRKIPNTGSAYSTKALNKSMLSQAANISDFISQCFDSGHFKAVFSEIELTKSQHLKTLILMKIFSKVINLVECILFLVSGHQIYHNLSSGSSDIFIFGLSLASCILGIIASCVESYITNVMNNSRKTITWTALEIYKQKLAEMESDFLKSRDNWRLLGFFREHIDQLGGTVEHKIGMLSKTIDLVIFLVFCAYLSYFALGFSILYLLAGNFLKSKLSIHGNNMGRIFSNNIWNGVQILETLKMYKFKSEGKPPIIDTCTSKARAHFLESMKIKERSTSFMVLSAFLQLIFVGVIIALVNEFPSGNISTTSLFEITIIISFFKPGLRIIDHFKLNKEASTLYFRFVNLIDKFPNKGTQNKKQRRDKRLKTFIMDFDDGTPVIQITRASFGFYTYDWVKEIYRRVFEQENNFLTADNKVKSHVETHESSHEEERSKKPSIIGDSSRNSRANQSIKNTTQLQILPGPSRFNPLSNMMNLHKPRSSMQPILANSSKNSVDGGSNRHSLLMNRTQIQVKSRLSVASNRLIGSIHRSSLKHEQKLIDGLQAILKKTDQLDAATGKKMVAIANSEIELTVFRKEKIALIGVDEIGIKSLLLGIIGDNVVKGENPQIKIFGSVGYLNLNESPMTETSTIRDNILFGKDWEPLKYESIFMILNLSSLAESKLDDVNIEELPFKLTQSQRRRILLARILYADTDVYIFEDAFLSCTTASEIEEFKKVVMGYLQDKVVLYVTQSKEIIKESMLLFLVDKGIIKWRGTPSMIKQERLLFKNLLKSENGDIFKSLALQRLTLALFGKHKESNSQKEFLDNKKFGEKIGIKGEEESTFVGKKQPYLSQRGHRTLAMFTITQTSKDEDLIADLISKRSITDKKAASKHEISMIFRASYFPFSLHILLWTITIITVSISVLCLYLFMDSQSRLIYIIFLIPLVVHLLINLTSNRILFRHTLSIINNSTNQIGFEKLDLEKLGYSLKGLLNSVEKTLKLLIFNSWLLTGVAFTTLFISLPMMIIMIVYYLLIIYTLGSAARLIQREGYRVLIKQAEVYNSFSNFFIHIVPFRRMAALKFLKSSLFYSRVDYYVHKEILMLKETWIRIRVHLLLNGFEMFSIISIYMSIKYLKLENYLITSNLQDDVISQEARILTGLVLSRFIFLIGRKMSTTIIRLSGIEMNQTIRMKRVQETKKPSILPSKHIADTGILLEIKNVLLPIISTNSISTKLSLTIYKNEIIFLYDKKGDSSFLHFLVGDVSFNSTESCGNCIRCVLTKNDKILAKSTTIKIKPKTPDLNEDYGCDNRVYFRIAGKEMNNSNDAKNCPEIAWLNHKDVVLIEGTFLENLGIRDQQILGVRTLLIDLGIHEIVQEIWTSGFFKKKSNLVTDDERRTYKSLFKLGQEVSKIQHTIFMKEREDDYFKQLSSIKKRQSSKSRSKAKSLTSTLIKNESPDNIETKAHYQFLSAIYELYLSQVYIKHITRREDVFLNVESSRLTSGRKLYTPSSSNRDLQRKVKYYEDQCISDLETEKHLLNNEIIDALFKVEIGDRAFTPNSLKKITAIVRLLFQECVPNMIVSSEWTLQLSSTDIMKSIGAIKKTHPRPSVLSMLVTSNSSMNIFEFERALVLEEEQIVEDDTPRHLLLDRDSNLYKSLHEDILEYAYRKLNLGKVRDNSEESIESVRHQVLDSDDSFGCINKRRIFSSKLNEKIVNDDESILPESELIEEVSIEN